MATVITLAENSVRLVKRATDFWIAAHDQDRSRGGYCIVTIRDTTIVGFLAASGDEFQLFPPNRDQWDACKPRLFPGFKLADEEQKRLARLIRPDFGGLNMPGALTQINPVLAYYTRIDFGVEYRMHYDPMLRKVKAATAAWIKAHRQDANRGGWAVVEFSGDELVSCYCEEPGEGRALTTFSSLDHEHPRLYGTLLEAQRAASELGLRKRDYHLRDDAVITAAYRSRIGL
jgi:hypothetical protein